MNASSRARGGRRHGNSAAPRILAQQQTGPSLPFSNSPAPFCQNQPTSSKVNVGGKKSLCYFIQAELAWTITPPSAAGPLQKLTSMSF